MGLSGKVLLLLSSLLVVTVVYYMIRLYTYHTLDFHGIDDRHSTMHMIFEVLGIYFRTSASVNAWISEQHRKPSLQGKAILITGGNKGLGRGTVGHLASMGATIYLPCRTCDAKIKDQILKDAKEYRAYYGGDASTLKDVAVDVYQGFDLADLNSIDKYVAYLKAKGVKIPVLIANAGLVDPLGTPTKQGFESIFGVNYVGNVYFTNALLKSGILQPNARVVSVTSEDHRISTTFAERIEETKKPFGAPWGNLLDFMDRYGYSKLAQTTWYQTLARKSGVQVLDMCPGPIGSEIAAGNTGILGQLINPMLGLIFPSIRRASIPVVKLATSSEYDSIKVKHFHLTEPKPSRADTRDEKIQDQVWQWTEDLFAKRMAPA